MPSLWPWAILSPRFHIIVFNNFLFFINSSTGQLMKKEQEIHELKSKIAEVMAVMPPGAYPGSSPSPSSMSGSVTPRYFSNTIEGTVVEPLVNCVPSPLVQATSSSVVSGAMPAIPPVLPAAAGSTGGGDAGANSGCGSSSASSGSPTATPEPGLIWDQKSILDPNAACYRPKSN